MAKSIFTLYSCKVRLEGSVLNEVPKENITAPELEMYRGLHGSDAVVDIKEVGEIERKDNVERARIRNTFMNPLVDAPARIKAKEEMFRNLFGHDSLPLPRQLAEAVGSEEDDSGDEDDEDKVVAQPARAPRQRATRTVAPEAAFTE